MKLANWLIRPLWPRQTVRLRLTLMYGVLFVLSGAALLAIASGLVVGRSSEATSHVPVSGPPNLPSQLAQDNRQIQLLQGALQSATQAHSQLSQQLLLASLIALGIMAVVAALMGWLLAGRALRPLRIITATARRISEDNLHERLAFAGPGDELKDLADTIDGLLERLESAFAAQRRFVANASHELRTPLTTMRASLDVAMAKPEPMSPQATALAGRLRVELDRVDELLEGFLVLARAQHGALPGQEVLALDELVAEAVHARAGAIRDSGLTLHRVGGGHAAPVLGSRTLVRRMVDNVLDNAIVHNEAAGWIGVSISTDGKLARVIIENGGVVLDDQQVAQLAQPFRRLGADRIGSDRGSGLGLSIVAAIAVAHGGGLDLRARAEGGLRVVIELPLATQSALAGVQA